MESGSVDKKAGLGHNQPPSQIQFANETTCAIGDWLKTHPIIQTEEQAKEYKLLRDRGKSCIYDMNDERKARNGFHERVIQGINEEYKEPIILLNRVLGEGDDRFDVWIKQEKEKRRRIKEEAWKKVQQAEEAVRAASEKEHAAREEAALGVETDILAASRDAQGAINVLGRLEREALREERNERVRVAGGYRRALTTREGVSFVITDPVLAVQETGWTERLYKSLEVEVRQFYRKKGRPPKGVSVELTSRIS